MLSAGVKSVIPLGERLASALVHSEALGGHCYVVLTRGWLGWMPALLPLGGAWVMLQREFYCIPLSAVRRIRVVPKHFMSLTTITLELSSSEVNCPVIDLTLFCPCGFVGKLQRRGFSVEGAEYGSLRTALGFFNNYGWYVWFGCWVVAGFSLHVLAFRISPALVILAMSTWFSALCACSLVLDLAMRILTPRLRSAEDERIGPRRESQKEKGLPE